MSNYDHAVINTKYGKFEIIGSAKGIRSVKKLQEDKALTPDIPDCLQTCAAQLLEYFDGKRTTFDIQPDWDGASPFNIKVWEALLLSLIHI